MHTVDRWLYREHDGSSALITGQQQLGFNTEAALQAHLRAHGLVIGAYCPWAQPQHLYKVDPDPYGRKEPNPNG